MDTKSLAEQARMLETAISIAVQTHSGQLDKGGEPYILHPLRLMMRFSETNQRIVAVLHDVIEDGEMTAADMKSAGFTDEIVDALLSLTRGDESYEEYLECVASNPISRAVKLADLEDNMRITRLKAIGAKDLARLEKYHKAFLRLSSLA